MKSPSAVHVARRYMESGLFEGPPAMMRDILPWMLYVYAGHVLAHVETRLMTALDVTGPHRQEIQVYQDILARVPKEVPKLIPGKTLRFSTPKGVLGIRRSEAYLSPQGHTIHFVNEDNPGPEYKPLYEIGKGSVKLKFEQFKRYELHAVLPAVERLLQPLITSAERQIARFKGVSTSVDDRMLVDLRLLQRECHKYTTKSKKYTSKASRKFPIDITGWKYAQGDAPLIKLMNDAIDKRNADRQSQIDVAYKTLAIAQKGYDAAIQGDTETYDAALKALSSRDWRHAIDDNALRTMVYKKERPTIPEVWMPYTYGMMRAPVSDLEAKIEPHIRPSDVAAALRAAGWTEITATLHFQGHVERGGQWSTAERELQVDSPQTDILNLDSFNVGIERIRHILRHELQHVGQAVLKVIQQMKEEAGLPSPRMRSPKYQPGGHPTSGQGTRQPHALRDVEFYTRLADEVDKFLAELRKFPKSSWRSLLIKWIQPKGTFMPRSQFFFELKTNQPDKWQKAVSEFVKAVGEQIDIPP